MSRASHYRRRTADDAGIISASPWRYLVGEYDYVCPTTGGPLFSSGDGPGVRPGLSVRGDSAMRVDITLTVRDRDGFTVASCPFAPSVARQIAQTILRAADEAEAGSTTASGEASR